VLSWPPSVRIFLAAGPTDMRKGFDSLASAVEASMALNPFSGHLLVFRSRRGERIKVLWWDRGGNPPVRCEPYLPPRFQRKRCGLRRDRRLFARRDVLQDFQLLYSEW
jgi:hypothetical protein